MRRPGYIELIWYKGLADLNAEASRAYIGFIWWILEPLLYMGAFYVVLDLGVRTGGTHMVLFLLSGLVPWKWFASTVQNGANSIQANSGLILQVYIPKYVLPWMVLVTNGMKFFIILALLMLLAAFTKGAALSWLALPLLVLVEMMLVLSVATFAASLVPLLPDLNLVIDNGLLMMMFLSGVITDISRLPPGIQRVLGFNPMVHVIAGFRAVLIEQTWPDWSSLAWVAGFSLLLYTLAYKLLQRFDRAYPKLMLV